MIKQNAGSRSIIVSGGSAIPGPDLNDQALNIVSYQKQSRWPLTKRKKGPHSSHIDGQAVEYAENLITLGVTMSES